MRTAPRAVSIACLLLAVAACEKDRAGDEAVTTADTVAITAGMQAPQAVPSIAPSLDGYEQPQPQASREGYTPIAENEFQDAARVPLSTFAIDVDAASYANVRRFLLADG